ncbi:MAG: HNH endonuclease [Acidobacteriota bacterium]
MTAKAISRAVRRMVRQRAGNRCEYCRHPADYACAPFVCEHILPRVFSEDDSIENLAFACAACNGHKYAKTEAPDAQTRRSVSLFHPRRQQWSRHFQWSDDSLFIIGRTATGRATVDALHLNRPEVVNLRRALKALGEHPPSKK